MSKAVDPNVFVKRRYSLKDVTRVGRLSGVEEEYLEAVYGRWYTLEDLPQTLVAFFKRFCSVDHSHAVLTNAGKADYNWYRGKKEEEDCKKTRSDWILLRLRNYMSLPMKVKLMLDEKFFGPKDLSEETRDNFLMERL